MQKDKTTREILAPAGSIEQLIAAVNNGCDSVYLGLDSFNARMKAPNFTTENIGQWIDYCHLFGVKVYVAINTSLKNNEFAKAVKLLETVYLNNADGVIVTDLALMRIASRLSKPFDVVASTQLNAHDSFGAKFLSDCGATTVVCARESSIEEIRDIVSTGVNVECFIHGATCVCQSGQCLFSAMVGGNSGNRGLCAQPCRKLYSANGENFGYLLSARDLCGLDIARRLSENGVTTFKIEGRNRRAEYAGITSRVYKQLFDNGFEYRRSDTDALAEMYNRSMSTLSYLDGDNKDIIAPNVQNHVGVKVGTVKGKGFVAEREVVKGDGLKVFHGDTEVCGGLCLGDGTGFVSADFSGVVSDGMEVRRTTSVSLCKDILDKKKLLSVRIEFEAYSNERAVLKANCNGVEVTVNSDFVVPKAEKVPTLKAEITNQLQKTGNSHYTISDIMVNIGEIFLAKSQINGLRRLLFETLDKAIVQAYNKQFCNRQSKNNRLDYIIQQATNSQLNEMLEATDDVPKHKQMPCENTLAVVCHTQEELAQARNIAQIVIYKPCMIDKQSIADADKYDAFIDLPSFSDNIYLYDLMLNNPVGIVCHNVGHVGLARSLNLPYIAGSGLNIYNDYIANEFSDAKTFVYSLELTLSEIAQFSNKSGLIFVDGDVALMKLVHCPYKLNYNCNCSNCKASKQLIYKDELGNIFTIVRRKDGRCSFELINGLKLSVVSKITSGGRFLIDYNPEIVAHYSALNSGIQDGYVESKPYTKGRLFNKVN
ncbi:MAG: U32 family peptidase [Clostridiales bacterium]|nr:U32 family peptidase [Clostridiales bacterium]